MKTNRRRAWLLLQTLGMLTRSCWALVLEEETGLLLAQRLSEVKADAEALVMHAGLIREEPTEEPSSFLAGAADTRRCLNCSKNLKAHSADGLCPK